MARGDNYEYDVCLSFAGEQRAYVEKVASLLKQKDVRVFYDAYEQSQIWGQDLYERLDYVYRKAARYCVIFASREYAGKAWTSHERRSAQARALEESEEYVLPAKFDDAEIPGIPPTIAYVDLSSTSPNALADMIIAKLSSEAKAESGPSLWVGSGRRRRNTSRAGGGEAANLSSPTTISEDFARRSKPHSRSTSKQESEPWDVPSDRATIDARVRLLIPSVAGVASLQGIYLFGFGTGLETASLSLSIAYLAVRLVDAARFARIKKWARRLQVTLMALVAVTNACILSYYFAGDFIRWHRFDWLRWPIGILLGVLLSLWIVVATFYIVQRDGLHPYPSWALTIPALLAALSVTLPMLAIADRPFTTVVAVSSLVMSIMLMTIAPRVMLRFRSLSSSRTERVHTAPFRPR